MRFNVSSILLFQFIYSYVTFFSSNLREYFLSFLILIRKFAARSFQKKLFGCVNQPFARGTKRREATFSYPSLQIQASTKSFVLRTHMFQRTLGVSTEFESTGDPNCSRLGITR